VGPSSSDSQLVATKEGMFSFFFVGVIFFNSSVLLLVGFLAKLPYYFQGAMVVAFPYFANFPSVCTANYNHDCKGALLVF